MLDTNLQLFQCTNVPNDDVSTQGGGIDLSASIPGLAVGELIPKGTYNALGGSSVVWRYACGLYNSSTTDSFYQGVLWVPNMILPVAAAGVLGLVSDNAADLGQVNIYGFDASGNPTTQNVTLAGLSTVYTSGQFGAGSTIRKAATYDPTGVTPTAVAGNVSLIRGTSVGVIPAPMGDAGNQISFDFATGEYEIGVGSSALAAATAGTSWANRLTDPSGVTFYKPYTLGTGLALPTIGPLEWVQIFLRWTGMAGTPKTLSSQLGLFVQGHD